MERGEGRPDVEEMMMVELTEAEADLLRRWKRLMSKEARRSMSINWDGIEGLL